MFELNRLSTNSIKILGNTTSQVINIRKGNGLQRYSILRMIVGSVILNIPETNIAQLAMVIMRINEIDFMSIITIQVGQCLIPVCSTEDKI